MLASAAPLRTGPRPSTADPLARPFGRARPGKASTWLLAAGAAGFAVLVLVVGCCGLMGLLVSQSDKSQQEALKAADRLYAKDPAQAVANYKIGYPGAGSRQAEVLARIVDFEAEKGTAAEAAKWVERGLADGVNPAYQTAGARDLAAKAQRDKAARDAAGQAEQAARAKKGADDRGGRDRAQANRNLTRDQLRGLLGGKTQQGVLDALGKPDETQDQEGLGQLWYYWNAGVDPVTKRKAAVVQVVFEGGVVSSVNFN